MLARFVLCMKLWKKEVYELLSREQKEKQRAFSPIKTCVKLMMGIILLAADYGIGCVILSSELGIKRMFRMTCIFAHKNVCEADDGNHSSGSRLWDRMRDTEFGTWDKKNVSYDCNFMFLRSTRYILFLSGPGISV